MGGCPRRVHRRDRVPVHHHHPFLCLRAGLLLSGGMAKKRAATTAKGQPATSPSKKKAKSAAAVPAAVEDPPATDEPEETFEHKVQNMLLHNIIKENHGAEVTDIVFQDCSVGATMHENILATVGSTQANIYDNQHLGTNLDIMCNFVNEPTEYSQGGTLRVCCWVTVADGAEASLVVAGDSNEISVINVVGTCVQYLLKGHTKSIAAIAPIPGRSGLLLSSSSDGTMRLWHIASESCVRVYHKADTSAMAALVAHPAGAFFFATDGKGTVRVWPLPSDKDLTRASRKTDEVNADVSIVAATSAKGHAWNQLVIPARCYEATGSADGPATVRLLGKTVQGRVVSWDVALSQKGKGKRGKASEVECAVTELSSFKLGDDTGLCKMAVTKDGEYVCGGDDDGTLFIRRVSTGGLIRELEYYRIKGQVQAITFSKDERYILFANASMIFRYDYWDDLESEGDEDEE